MFLYKKFENKILFSKEHKFLKDNLEIYQIVAYYKSKSTSPTSKFIQGEILSVNE